MCVGVYTLLTGRPENPVNPVSPFEPFKNNNNNNKKINTQK